MDSIQINPNADGYYSRLGVSTDADKQTIRKAAKKGFSEYHPDQNDSPDANTEFRQIKAAKDALIDEDSRRDYDILHAKFDPATATELFEDWTHVSKHGSIEEWVSRQRSLDLEENTDSTSPLDTTPSQNNGHGTTPSPRDTIDEDSDESDGDDTTAKYDGDSTEKTDGYDYQRPPHSKDESTGGSIYKKENTPHGIPDDVQDTGLDGGDLWSISHKLSEPTIIEGNCEMAYDEGSNMLSIKDAFTHDILVDLETGDVAVPGKKTPFVADFLRSVRARYDREKKELSVRSRDEKLEKVVIDVIGRDEDSSLEAEKEISDDAGTSNNSPKGTPSKRTPRHEDVDIRRGEESNPGTKTDTESDKELRYMLYSVLITGGGFFATIPLFAVNVISINVVAIIGFVFLMTTTSLVSVGGVIGALMIKEWVFG